MPNRFLTSLSFLTLALTACQAREFGQQTWRKSDGPIPSWAKRSDFQVSQKEIRIGPEAVVHHVQMTADVPVEGSSRREIRANGSPVWISQTAVDHPLGPVQQAKLIAAKINVKRLQQRVKSAVESDGLRLDREPILTVLEFENKFETRMRADVSDMRTGHFYRDFYRLDGKLDRRIAVGASFFAESLPAQLFPLGPKNSALSWVDLFVQKNLTSFGNSVLAVRSQTGLEINPSTDVLRFPLDDPRFDQVQVFYFVERFLNHLKSNHGFELPSRLNIETHIGHPDRTNAAFYHQNIVRLGTGDGVNYQDLMRDPTIVSHEVGHAVIDALTNLPFSGEGGSINEGLADFLAGSALKTPFMGESSFLGGPFKRRLDNEKTFKDKQGKMYADSEIVSGLFWKIRSKIGAEKAELLALRTLPRLLPSANFASLREELLTLIAEMPPTDRQAAEAVMVERKWK